MVKRCTRVAYTHAIQRRGTCNGIRRPLKRQGKGYLLLIHATGSRGSCVAGKTQFDADSPLAIGHPVIERYWTGKTLIYGD